MAARFLDREFLEQLWGAARVLRLAEESVVEGGTADDAIASAIELAESDALSRLSGRYTDSALPTTPETTPSALKQHIASFAIGVLSLHHDLQGEDVVRAVTRADQYFSGVANNRFSIGLADAPAVDQGEALIWSSTTGAPAKFVDLDEEW